MDNDLHDIDKIFFNSLEPNEENPSENVWDKINKKLDNESSKKPGAWYVWAKRSLIIFLIIGLGFGSYQFFFQHKSALQQEKTTSIRQHFLQLQSTIDTLKRENIGKENKTNFNKTSFNKASTGKGFSQDAIRSTDTITGLNKIDISSLKNKITTSNTVANNENFLSNKKQKFKNKEINIAENTIPLKYKLSSNRKLKTNFLINKDVAINLNKINNIDLTGNKSVTIKIKKNELNRETPGDETRLLSAKTVVCDVNDIYTIQSFSTLNLPSIKAESLPLLNLVIDSTSKKTVRKKYSFTNKSRFYLSMFAAPEWQGYQLKDNDDQPNNGLQNQGQDTKNKIKHREDEDASLVAGIGIGYRLSKRLSIESGLRYSEYDIRTDTVKLFAAFNTTTNTIGYKINTSLGYGYLNNVAGITSVIGDSMVANNLRQSVNYLSMPLLLRYETGKGRISFNPGLGFVFNFILNSNIRTNLGNGQKQMVHLQGLKKMWVGMMFTPSVYYRFSSHISFGLEPYFNYTISPINKATVVDSYPYGVGLGAVIRYHF